MRSGDCPQCLHEKGAVWLPPKKQILLASQQYDHFCGYDFRPDYLPGCVLFCCTNTAAFGSGAVGFPAVACNDPNFTIPANWVLGNWLVGGGHLTIAGGGGDVRNPTAFLTIGNTYDVTYTIESKVGAGNVFVWCGNGTPGTFRTAAGTYTERLVCSGSGTMYFTASVGVTCSIANCTWTAVNSNSLTDLTGLGHHPVQATAASQPLWVASGSGGVLRVDGTADRMETAAFTLDQPAHIFMLTKWTGRAAWNYLLDGAASDCGSMARSAGSNVVKVYAGAGYSGPTLTDATWTVIDSSVNGASSACGLNGAAPTAGATGASNPGGISIGSTGNGTDFAIADFAAVVAYNRALSEPERQRVVRFLNRQKAMLAL